MKLKINHLKKKIIDFSKKNKIKLNIITSPMFLNTRDDFKKYLSKSKKPFMAVFYKDTRRKMNILMNGEDPVGGKWSFDEDNRKKLPKGTKVPSFPKIDQTVHTIKLKKYYRKEVCNTPWFNRKFLVCN